MTGLNLLIKLNRNYSSKTAAVNRRPECRYKCLKIETSITTCNINDGNQML